MTSGRIIAQQWMSVDGFVADATGDETAVFVGVDEPADRRSEAWNRELLAGVDEVVLGRRTYEQFVQFWPDADAPMAERVNAVPKVVASTTLTEAPWGAHHPATVVDDVVAHTARRRDEGAALLVWGSLEIVARLVEAHLLDELDLFVAPVLLGAGTPVVAVPAPARLHQLASEDWGAITHLRYSLLR